jgi:GMP synthase PP-ATPase subunit
MADNNSKPTAVKKKAVTRTPEQKSSAFNELATARVNKALKAMRQIKYLANPTTYTYSTESAKAIVDALIKGVTEIRDSFADPKSSKTEGFKLG